MLNLAAPPLLWPCYAYRSAAIQRPTPLRSSAGGRRARHPSWTGRRLCRFAGLRGEDVTQEQVVPTTLDEVKESCGWQEGDKFLFGYGALLAPSVWRRRGIYETRGGGRRALRATAIGRTLKFNVKGGYASIETLESSQNTSDEILHPEAHGILVPVSKREIALHAEKEGGYILQTIAVRPYGSDLEMEAVAFVSSWWRRTNVDLKPSETYLDRIRTAAATRGLCMSYRSWLDEAFSAASAADEIAQQALLTPNDVGARIFLIFCGTGILFCFCGTR